MMMLVVKRVVQYLDIGASYYIVVAILYLFNRLGYAEIDAVDCLFGAYRVDGSGQGTTTASLYIC